MTEQEALEVARKQIRAENAAYMREWRKRNPEKDRATAVDPDNSTALAEMPHALKPAAELAEKLYCAVVNME